MPFVRSLLALAVFAALSLTALPVLAKPAAPAAKHAAASTRQDRLKRVNAEIASLEQKEKSGTALSAEEKRHLDILRDKKKQLETNIAAEEAKKGTPGKSK